MKFKQNSDISETINLYDIFIKQKQKYFRRKGGEKIKVFFKLVVLISIVGAAVFGIKIFLEEK